jgi:hypothetical protein
MQMCSSGPSRRRALTHLRPVIGGRRQGEGSILRYEDWQLDEPAGKGVEAVRPIRDDIGAHVEAAARRADSRASAHRLVRQADPLIR